MIVVGRDRAIGVADDGVSRSDAAAALDALRARLVRDRRVNDVDRLFREYHQPLVRYLTRRLGDRDWAEEVAQETFLRAVKQETIVSERSWLFAVATNLVRDEARKDIRRRRTARAAARTSAGRRRGGARAAVDRARRGDSDGAARARCAHASAIAKRC